MAQQGKVKLVSSDNVEFEVDYEVGLQMANIKKFIQLEGKDTIFPVYNVSSTMLSKVIEYVKYHLEAKESGQSEEEVKNWDRQFVNVDQTTLCDLIMASNYLSVKDLFELLCQTVADMIKDLVPEKIRQLLGIKNDFTPEEEEELRRQNEWAFD
ncbi:hypothetical protein SUGI_0490750 [Cryptomeria japonica]|uniref:SKP1-like protein 1B n=1 Tax=Cryptomeria japonica TaxID=3369 RepID=UPI002408EAB6|nr:SKP1-like protein 1B [Cryptomeria japonica]GLJ25616.1 hypothetical protein SUGI_0490750 [Cryptomeria japonica]